jgi:hypothetical protein
MNFLDVLAKAKEGSRIRRKIWFLDSYMTFSNGKLKVKNTSDDANQYNDYLTVSNITAEDWYIMSDERLEKFENGKVYHDKDTGLPFIYINGYQYSLSRSKSKIGFHDPNVNIID